MTLNMGIVDSQLPQHGVKMPFLSVNIYFITVVSNAIKPVLYM